MKAIVVWRESRIGAHRALVDQSEAVRRVECDERVVVPPGIEAEPLTSERFAPRDRPGDDGAHEPATPIRRRAREAMQIDVCAALELSPDRRIFVRDGEDADERIAVQNPEEQARYHLIENPAVRKLGPLEGAMCGLKRAGVGVGGAD